ncbi:hypothetical protein [Rhodococcus chondri]|uniref:hypothetical protein n=1 Tax=Rhodococcus chondri TaxID=3065941 RepID=UPI0038B4D493
MQGVAELVLAERFSGHRLVLGVVFAEKDDDRLGGLGLPSFLLNTDGALFEPVRRYATVIPGRGACSYGYSLAAPPTVFGTRG